MKQITQLLPEDLRKELYELWEVSIHTRLAFFWFLVFVFCFFVFTATEFIYLCFSCKGYANGLYTVVLSPGCYRNLSLLTETFCCLCSYSSYYPSTRYSSWCTVHVFLTALFTAMNPHLILFCVRIHVCILFLCV